MSSTLADKAVPIALDGEPGRKSLIIVIAIDQTEELFRAEALFERFCRLSIVSCCGARVPRTARSTRADRFLDRAVSKRAAQIPKAVGSH